MIQNRRRSINPRSNAAKPITTNRPIAFYLDILTMNLLEQAAKKFNLNRSAMVRKIIQEYFGKGQ